MKRSFIFSGVALVSLLVSGCTLMPTPKKKSSSVIPNPSGITTDSTGGSSLGPTTSDDSSSEDISSSSDVPPGPSSSSSSIVPPGPSSSSSGTSIVPPPGPFDPETYYKACEGLSGTQLASTLKSINEPKVKAYTWERDEDADEALDDSKSVFCIYTRHNIPKTNHVSSGYSWDKWNKEHIWPQGDWPTSKTDTHNYFACEGEINNQRSSKSFAEGGTRITVHGHQTDCYQTSSTFEPCDDAKGEVARSLMYGAIMYPNDRDLTDMISYELAIKWHLEHPSTERDIRRNNVVYESDQKNRNPFVDHPEYACKIWGTKNSTTKNLCGIN